MEESKISNYFNLSRLFVLSIYYTDYRQSKSKRSNNFVSEKLTLIAERLKNGEERRVVELSGLVFYEGNK